MTDKPILRDSEDVENKTPTEASPEKKPTKVLVRCPDCPWRAGFKDEHTYCSTCNGSGKVEADPLT